MSVKGTSPALAISAWLNNHRLAKPLLAGGLAVGLVAGLVAGGLTADTSAQAAPGKLATIYVNSTDFGGPDSSPGDGMCDAGGQPVVLNGEERPRCTLRAALEEANALSATLGAADDQSVLVTLDPDFAGGTIVGTASAIDAMQASGATNLATGTTWYVVTSPMTIDLKNALGMVSNTVVSGDAGSTGILVNGHHVTIKNASNILTNNTSFVIGASSKHVTIDSGTTYQKANDQAIRFIVVNNGASDFTFSNYQVGGLRNTVVDAAALMFTTGSQPGATTTNVLVKNVDFTSPQVTSGGVASTTCTASNGSGCSNGAVVLYQLANLDGFEMTGCTLRNLKPNTTTPTPIPHYIFSAYRSNTPNTLGALGNINIHHNTFTNNVSATSFGFEAYMVWLPDQGTLTGQNYIHHNTFDNSGVGGQPYAIGWWGALSGTQPSHLTIADNYFDGFTRSGIAMASNGLVTVERNTFGPKHASSSATSGEYSAYNNVMFTNYDAPGSPGSNQALATWLPATISVSNSCVATIEAQAPKGLTPPPTPVRLDVFWTASTKAEKYLSSTGLDVTGTKSISVQLPESVLDANKRPTGYLRLQTQTKGANGEYAQLSSSQYSYAIPIPTTAACTPPKVTAISPTDGPVSGGGTLTVTGTGFSASPSPVVTFRSGATEMACTNVTVVSATKLTCVIPPSPRPGGSAGPVDVVVSLLGNAIGVFTDGYTYWLDGRLTVVKRGWLDADGLTYDQIIGGGATEVASGAELPDGTTVWWTYTVTYVYTDPKTGQPSHTGEPGATGVKVKDSVLGTVCKVDVLVNTPVGCVAQGEVSSQ